ncbi:MAG: ATP-binding protein [Roseibium sp.]
MDHQTQSFMDLSAIKDLAELVADPRAAWLWSADGAKVLWANAAGAAFFSVRSISDLAGLTSLERSPARPHIARIATSGLEDRFSMERLRFYRGLRVMLLTCQCRKIPLENGSYGALIICGDKGLATTKDPVGTFARFISSDAQTVFVTTNGAVTETVGKLEGSPEDLPLPEEQTALFGPLDLSGAFHDGVVLQASSTQKLIVLDNEPLSDELETDQAEDMEDGDAAAPEAALLDVPDVPASEEHVANETPNAATDNQDISLEVSTKASEEIEAGTSLSDELDVPVISVAESSLSNNRVGEPFEEAFDEEVSAPSTGLEEDASTFEAVTSEKEAQSADPIVEPDNADIADRVETEGEEEQEITSAETADDPETNEFIFQPRRRSIRFAWKMDIAQRFTFLSDEFSDVLGPSSTDIIGLTWAEVSEKFNLDPRGTIARALDRRDTWSGKTVNWPVSDAALRVPVDMAALPAFDRNRKFEGYRGFGVCRTADAQPDENGSLVSPAMAAFDETFAAEHVEELVPDEVDASDLADLKALDAPTSDENINLSDDQSVADTSTKIDEPDHSEVGKPEGTVSPSENSVDDLKPAQPNSLAGKTFIGASASAVVGTLSKFTTRSETPASKPQADNSDEADEPQLAQEAEPTKSPTHSEATDPANENDATLLEETVSEIEDVETSENVAASTQPAVQNEEAVSVEAEVPTEAADPADEQQSKTEATLGDSEPVGISGSAPLDPSEIESAVKSLAKNYNNAPKPSLDLFDEEKTISTSEEIEDTSLSEHTDEQETSAASTKELDPANDLFEPETSNEPTEDQKRPTLKSVTTDTAPDNADGKTADSDNLTDDEREFFEETAAFEAKDKAAETDETPPEDDEPVQRTGQVIPLVTARPRIVPVDTSSLSRPERQAFRKIAEALGARLEGDLENFDEPDPEEETVAELPPEIPEAGPIDPSLLDRLPIGIAIVNDREVLYGNKALLKLLGYNSVAALSEAGGLEALFIDDSEDLPDADGMDGEVDEPMKVRHADGGVRCVDAHMHSVPWNETKGLMISITERPSKAVQPDVPASPNFFAEVRSELDSARDQITEMDTILETATDGVLVLDQNGSIVKVNGSAEALFSANRVDMVGAPFTDFLAPESHRAAADYLDGLSRNGVASILNDGREVLGTVPSGGLIPLFMTMGRITDTKDDAKYCAVLRDITQWKTAEEELTQAKRQAENASSQKSDFLAKISHEIRTPLNAIIGFSEVMMEERFGAIGNDRYKDYLKDIRTSGSHIMSLINDLLDLSKIEAGKMDLKFSAVSTNEIINECVALMQPQANRERVIIRASLPDSVPNVVADPRSLRQIVLNLLSNAIKYNKSGGQVILSTALETNGEVALRVRDTGTGMTAKQLTAALEPFRQLHTASRGGGTGLGLPLTKALVEANRANFHIDSTPDQGTLVEITFPTQRVLAE